MSSAGTPIRQTERYPSGRRVAEFADEVAMPTLIAEASQEAAAHSDLINALCSSILRGW